MSQRVCDVCGKQKDVSGGATCEKGHFVCHSCKTHKGLIVDSKRTKCPICDKPIR